MHRATHCDIITALAGHMPLLSNLKVRLCKFVKMCREHKYEIVKAVASVWLENVMYFVQI